MRQNRRSATSPLAVTPRSVIADAPRILVVDDDVVLCVYNAEVLSSAGFEVDIAEDGEAGWQALQTKEYALVITDNNMPRVSGMELLQKLRSESIDIPVIMVSGAMPVEELARHPNLRLAAALSKPFTGENLVGMVKKVLSQAKGAHFPTQDEPARTVEPSVEVAPA